MKLLTLNCHAWHEENQAEKIRYLAENIKEKDYDVINRLAQRLNMAMSKRITTALYLHSCVLPEKYTLKYT